MSNQHKMIYSPFLLFLKKVRSSFLPSDFKYLMQKLRRIQRAHFCDLLANLNEKKNVNIKSKQIVCKFDPKTA